jgi:hypothetical protein
MTTWSPDGRLSLMPLPVSCRRALTASATASGNISTDKREGPVYPDGSTSGRALANDLPYRRDVH